MPQKPAALNTSIRTYLYRRNMYKKAIKQRIRYLGKNHQMISLYKMKMRENEEKIIIKILNIFHLDWIVHTKIFWRIFWK